jgi:hypothetical protein
VSEIKNRMTLDSKPFTSELDKAQSRVSGFSQNAAKNIAQAFSAAAFVQMANGVLSAADEIDNLAKQTGIGVEQMQAMQVVAKEAGLSFEMLQGIIAKTTAARAAALTGDKKAIAAFQAMGITLEALEGMNPQSTFEAVGRSLNFAGSNADVAAAATDILGVRSARLQDTMIMLGNEGVDALAEKYLRMGQIVETKTIKALDAVGDRFALLTRQAKSFGMEMFNAVAGSIQAIAEITGAMSAGSTLGEAIQISSELGRQQTAEQMADPTRFTPSELGVELPDSGSKEKSDVKDKIEALRDQIRFRNLSIDQQEAELRYMLEISRTNEMLAETDQDRYEALKQIHDMELDLARITEAQVRNRERLAENQMKAAKELAEIQSGEGVSGLSYGTGAGLEKIGGFSGGGNSGVQTSLDRQIRIQEQIREFNRRMADSLERNPPLTVGGI